MNAEETGYCYANGKGHGRIYGIRTDYRGNNEVTGEGEDYEGKCRFTCTEIEVYKVSKGE